MNQDFICICGTTAGVNVMIIIFPAFLTQTTATYAGKVLEILLFLMKTADCFATKWSK
jgi:hypothetical protein